MKALARCVRVDDAKVVRDKFAALTMYATQIKDRELLGYAIDIKMRAEDRAGELLKTLLETGQRSAGGRPKKPSHGATVFRLSDLKTTRSQASRWVTFHELPR